MSDSVYDASFIGYANCSLEEPTPERRDFLRKLITSIEKAISGKARVRYNSTLSREYSKLVKEYRNDVIDEFFTLLTSNNVVLVTRNLRRHEHEKAEECNWPFHDRHLIAAAIDGEDVTIYVTEQRLERCTARVRRILGIKVSYVPPVLPEPQ